MKRKVAVVTGSRAEYGLLYWLIKEISADADLSLQLVVTGTHLSKDFGATYQQIEQDGFVIDAKVDMQLISDKPAAIVKSMGLGLAGFAEAYETLNPDLLVVLGDRFEILAAVQAALIIKIPVAHIHGGEITEGAIDDSIRHAITKMSHLHFTAAESYKNRVIQLGEEPENVFNVGAIGLDYIKRSELLSRAELEKDLNIKFKERNFLITYHPVTIKKEATHEGLLPLLEALDTFEDVNLIFTGSNADEGGRKINQLIKEYLAERPGRGYVFTTLGSKRYLSMLKEIDLVLGNSSSGLIEAPAFNVATVDVGEREAGRLRASSIVHCAENKNDIIAAIKKALSENFQVSLKNIDTPYGQGGASQAILNVIKSAKLPALIKKRFHDVEVGK